MDALERNGHHVAVLDADLYSLGGQPLARLRHTNIFKVRRASETDVSNDCPPVPPPPPHKPRPSPPPPTHTGNTLGTLDGTRSGNASLTRLRPLSPACGSSPWSRPPPCLLPPATWLTWAPTSSGCSPTSGPHRTLTT